MKKVAIQGGIGAYHGIAAGNFFGEEVEIIPCNTFKDIFTCLKNDSGVIGIMAIENTIAGSLLPNYNLLRTHDFPIIGEYKQRISHCFAAMPGQKIEDICEVQSHPMALMQCGAFLDQYPELKIVEHEDTALAARDVAQQKLMGTAAICSEQAAQIYGLDILAKSIETDKHNYTRFLLFADYRKAKELEQSPAIGRADKASISFCIPHEEGSLFQVLGVLSFYKMNLTKIQSLPIVGHEWQYRFYIDITFDEQPRFHQAIKAIDPLTTELQIQGIYKAKKQNEA